MALYKISDRHPNYREIYFQGKDLKGLPVYTLSGHDVGRVEDLLVDDQERIQQVVVNTGSKKVLVPASRCSKPNSNSGQEDRVYLRDIERDELMSFSPYQEDSASANLNSANPTSTTLTATNPTATNPTATNRIGEQSYEHDRYLEIPVEQSAPVESSTPLEGVSFATANTNADPTGAYTSAYTNRAPEAQAASFSRTPQPNSNPSSNLDPQLNSQPDLQSSLRPIQLYEEHVVTSKQRIKTGEVKISKHTTTDTSSSNIPITREKVIIEIESIYGGETRVNFGDAQVDDDGTVRMGIYEEQAEVCRRIVPYQNIAVRKEIVEDNVTVQQTLRREELTVDATAPYVEVNSTR